MQLIYVLNLHSLCVSYSILMQLYVASKFNDRHKITQESIEPMT